MLFNEPVMGLDRARFHVDRARLRLDLVRLAGRSRELKRHLTKKWEAPMGAQQAELVEVRRRTTARLVLLAWTRGRYHVNVKPRSGGIPGTSQYYLEDPVTYCFRCLDWNRDDYRDRVVRALLPEYEVPTEPASMGATP